MFIKNYNGGLEFGNQFPNMLEAIRNYVPQPKITAQEIKNNPLALGAPFREALLSEFKEYGTPQLIDAVEGLSTFRITLSKEQLEKRWQASKQSERTSTWSKAVKNNYHYHCAIPGCDAEGTLFIQAAHIMPFSAEDIITNNKHRSDVENGVALCLSCHKMFDAGLFTFDGYGKIVPSKFIYSSELIKTEKQINVMRILDSQAKQLILPEKVHFNRVYALYHRENVFLGE